jgi:ABC-2 type transport system permease protein
MTNAVYLKTELRRSLRNRKFLLFSLGFPLLLFFMIAGPNRTAHLDGVAFPLYYMTGMAAWGSMTAVISIGARIAAERQLGWGRQMRLTPLSTARYFQAKVLGGYLMAVMSILALTAAGAALGVQLSLTRWLLMAVLVLVVLLPFAVLGVLMGHVLKVDTAGPAMGGVVTLLALVGGTWGPLASGGVLLALFKLVPSYWLVLAGRSALTGSARLPWQAWAVTVAWTAVLAALAAWVYRRDTARA